MPDHDLQSLLAVTRKVFQGSVGRKELLGRSKQERIFVGTAILLLFRSQAFDSGYVVRGPRGTYGRRVCELVALPDEGGGKSDELRPTEVVYLAAQVGLYQPRSPHQANRPVQLTPPHELIRLIAELGRTPAIDVFLREVVEQHGDNYGYCPEPATVLTEAAAVDLMDVDRYMAAAIDEVVSRYGPFGLRKLVEAAERRLEADDAL